MTEVRVQGLHKSHGDRIVVENSTFTVADGEIFVLLGPSGCGKTASLRMIAGLEKPSSGHLFFGGRDVTQMTAAERDVAFVARNPILYPHLDVRGNIAYPLKSIELPKRQIADRVADIARLFGIEQILGTRPRRLSNENRNRVALARALVRRPGVLLLDDPMLGLEPGPAAAMSPELSAVIAESGGAIIGATRELRRAMAVADRIAVMDGGILWQCGTPKEIYDRPASLRVAEYFGAPPMGFLEFHAGLKSGRKTVKLGGASVAVPELREDVPPSDLMLGVRPEHVQLDSESKLRGRVSATEFAGPDQIVHLETTHGRLQARVPASVPVHAGESHGIRLSGARLSLFDRQSGRALRTAWSAKSDEPARPRRG